MRQAVASTCSVVSLVDCLHALQCLYEAWEVDFEQLKAEHAKVEAELFEIKHGVKKREDTVHKLKSHVHDLKEMPYVLRKELGDAEAKLARVEEEGVFKYKASKAY